ncbi:MAG: hypothetical protein HYZ17_02335 [Betaproteobacteria bacterium]|nr:hypothetical protein [Betaproteobacteria bacterium]
MRQFSSRLLMFSLLSLFGLAAHAAQRTFVSTAGSDANTVANCANSSPCRSFGAALTVTDSGGEIIVLSSGGYGPTTVNKSVSIISPEGVYAGISVLSGNGVTIATAGVNVVLRGLTINGLGGTHGVNMTSGASLSIENCVITNFSSASARGVLVNAPAKLRVVDSLLRNDYLGVAISNGATATISGSKFLGNSVAIYVTDAFGGSSVTTEAFVDRSVASGGVTGFAASTSSPGNASRLHVSDSVVSDNSLYGIDSFAGGGGSEVTVANSRAFRNGVGLFVFGSGAKLIASGNVVSKNTVGLQQDSSGVLESAGDNAVRGNSTDVTGSITTTFTKM